MSFPLLWELTLGSWLTAALILLARLLFGRLLNARAKYALWLLLLLRLIPLPVRSPTSLLNYTPEPLRAEAVEAEYLAPAADRLTALAGKTVEDSAPAAERPSPWETLHRVWLFGAETVLAFYLLMYVVAVIRLRNMLPCQDTATLREYLRLKQLCQIGFSPRLVMGNQGLLGGFFSPVLVIPVDLRGEEAAPILLHELMHYKSMDVWLGLAFRLLCALHWFNPAVWLCFWLMRRDGELACDRRVLDSGLIGPRAYAKALMEEYQRCGETDPMPMTHWGTRGMMKRISDILVYRKSRPRDRILPIALAALILVFGVLSPWKSRILYGDRSLTEQTGCADPEAYIQALRQTSLGVFGMTWSELCEAGYLTEEEGSWSISTPEKRVYAVRRALNGQEVGTDYVFRTTLFTEAEGKYVLTEIRAAYPAAEDVSRSALAAEEELLLGWPALEERFALYAGSYFHPLAEGEEYCWELLDWQKRPEDLEDIFTAAAKGRKLSYSIRCSPVTLEDVLTEAELEALADLAVAKGWAWNRENGERLFGNWHLAGLVSKSVPGCWILNGEGLAMFLTRTGG